MKLYSVIIILFLLVGTVAAQNPEITPIYKIGMQDITLGGITLESKTLLAGRTSLFHFGVVFELTRSLVLC